MAILFLLMILLVKSAELSTVFEQHLKNISYEKYQMPSMGASVNVTVQVYVHSLGKINENDFTFQVGFYLRQWWNDPRLASKKSSHVIRTTSLDKLIWTPNTSVLDSHETKHYNDAIRTVIEPNGQVFVSRRLSAKSRCDMELQYYPMDYQNCQLALENYAYSISDINISWHSIPITRREGILLDGYNLIGINTATETYKIAVGNETEPFKLLYMHFFVERTFMFYVYRTYIPSMLLSIFSFASFWIPDTAVPGRVGIIVTGFLANIFILQGVSEQTVKVSYTTPMQIFLMVNITLIICALMEYVIILQLRRNKKPEVTKPERHTAYGSLIMYDHKKIEKSNGITQQNAVFKNDHLPEADFVPLNEKTSSPEKNKQQTTTNDVLAVDRVAQILLPILYIIFCCVYFAYFLNLKEKNMNRFKFSS